MGMSQSQNKSGRQKIQQQQQCIIVLCLLKQDQYNSLGFLYEDIKQKLNIFPLMIDYPYRIFVSDVEVFKASKEFQEYIQCVNLEGQLKRIVIFIDVSKKNKFIDIYKIIWKETYKQISEIVIFPDGNDSQQQRCNIIQQLQSWFNKCTYFADKQKCFQSIKQSCQDQSPIYDIQLNNISPLVDEQIIQNITSKIQNELQKLMIINMEQLEQDKFYFMNFRNQIIQEQFKSYKQKNQFILQCKFNYKIMEQISLYTNQVLEIILKLIEKEPNNLYFCATCKFYWSKGQNGYFINHFFNSYFKWPNCVLCSGVCMSLENQKAIYDQQKMSIQIDHCLQQLQQQNIPAQINSSQILEEDDIHHIMLIGKTGVGKTKLFTFLCDGESKNITEPTEEPIVKKCWNSNFTVMDTPPFELDQNNNEQIKQKFSTIFTQKQVSQIFIVVKYDRLPVMKQKMIDCLKYLESFRKKISIIIFNDNNNPVNEYQDALERTFDTKRILIFNLRSPKKTLKEDIENHLQQLNAKLEYLNIENTDFDMKKNRKEQKAMMKKLESIKMQKSKANIQQLLSENQDIYKQIEQFTKQISELNKKLNQNNQIVQQHFYRMEEEQSNSKSKIDFN